LWKIKISYLGPSADSDRGADSQQGGAGIYACGKDFLIFPASATEVKFAQEIRQGRSPWVPPQKKRSSPAH